MMLLHRVRFILAAGLALACISARAEAAGPSADPAKAADTLRSSNWQVECRNDGKALDCETSNRIAQADGGQVAVITLHPAPQGGGAVLVAQMPLGIALGTPVQITIDGKSPITLPIGSCIAQGCIASSSLPPAALASMRHGKDLGFSFGAPNGRVVSMIVSLQGFDIAYDRVLH